MRIVTTHCIVSGKIRNHILFSVVLLISVCVCCKRSTEYSDETMLYCQLMYERNILFTYRHGILGSYLICEKQ